MKYPIEGARWWRQLVRCVRNCTDGLWVVVPGMSPRHAYLVDWKLESPPELYPDDRVFAEVIECVDDYGNPTFQFRNWEVKHE